MLKKSKLNLFFSLFIVVFCLFLAFFSHTVVFANGGGGVVNKTVVINKSKLNNGNVDNNIKKGRNASSRRDISDSEVKVSKEKVNKMQLNIASPRPLKDVIILDAGHGYMDSGGGFNGCYEYIPNAQLVFKIANLLVDTGFFEVYLTHSLEYAGENLKIDPAVHSNHKFIHIILPEISALKKAKSKVGNSNYSSYYRASVVSAAIMDAVKKLRESRNKIYVLSLHHNVSGKNFGLNVGGKSAGFIVYYSNEPGDFKYRKENINFAKTILNFCFDLYGYDSNSGKSPRGDNFLVTQVGSPALLCEVDFIDNMERQPKILSDAHQNRMARGFKNAIMKIYGYEIKWANVKIEKNMGNNGVKIIVKNLSKSVDNLKFAIYGEGKVATNSRSVEWFDGIREPNGDFVLNLPKIVKHGKVNVDVYSKINEKLAFIDSDFNEFKI